MPTTGYPHSFLHGLSDFWQRFFADAAQLDALYEGSAVLIGQAYLDLMSATLGISLRDAIALDREYYRLVPVREDEVAFAQGLTVADDRWVMALPAPVVQIGSLDNKVYAPTASLEIGLDFEVVDGQVRFRVDPTDPAGTGLPLDGFARRSIDVSVGGAFAATSVAVWRGLGIYKGDTIRLLDVSPALVQRKRSDHTVAVVRDEALYVEAATPLPAPTTGLTYAVLRTPADAAVAGEVTFVADVAQLVRPGPANATRVDHGSVRLAARTNTGTDVVEGVDYVVNYETGVLTRIGGTPWQGGNGPFAAQFTWKQQVLTGTVGLVRATTNLRVLQLAAWAPDVRIDRRTLANNFGALIGREAASSEAYRAFLQGIFQLYLRGPVLERVESALNVVLNLPVIRDDGEVFQAIDLTDPTVDRVLTTSPRTGRTVAYTFPRDTPLRTDLVVGQVLHAFEPLTTAVTVTDYVQTPAWWHGVVIPRELFDARAVPSIGRRTASAALVAHVVGASDDPEIGDPGLYIGADEHGTLHGSDPAALLVRRRVGFVLMDQFLKYHVFTISFDALALASTLGVAFAQSLRDLQELVVASRPSHTFAFTRPLTGFQDVIDLDDPTFTVGQTVGGPGRPDQIVFADTAPVIGETWSADDYYTYATYTAATAFPVISTPITLANAAVAPRTRRLVRVYVATTAAGRPLVENLDYSVDYATAEVTRLTAWANTTPAVTYIQLVIGNPLDAPAAAGDMALTIGCVDPALVTAAFDPLATGWDGVVTPLSAPRDLGLVERALIIQVGP